MYKGRAKSSLTFSIIKSYSQEIKKLVFNECKLLKELNHPNIIKMEGWQESSNHIWVFFECLTGTTLKQILQED